MRDGRPVTVYVPLPVTIVVTSARYIVLMPIDQQVSGVMPRICPVTGAPFRLTIVVVVPITAQYSHACTMIAPGGTPMTASGALVTTVFEYRPAVASPTL